MNIDNVAYFYSKRFILSKNEKQYLSKISIPTRKLFMLEICLFTKIK